MSNLPKSGLQLVAEGLSGYLNDLGRAERATDSFFDGLGKAAKAGGVFGEMMTGALRRVGEIGVEALGDAARATGDFIKESITSAGDVEQNLNVLQVVAGATADQMAQISQRAIQLGGDLTLPATSAQDASRAMLELAKSGLSVDDTMKAAKGTLQLAAAGQLDAARAAEITSNALNSFRLSGDKAIVVADLLAAAAAKSSLEVVDVADSFKMASAVFSAFQGPVVGAEESMKQLTAAIALLGKAGIKGSDAGTSLKQMMMQLTAPSQKAKEQMRGLYLAALSTADAMDINSLAFGNASERAKALAGITETAGAAAGQMGDIAYDAAGKMRSMPEIIDLVSKATKTMTDEQRNNYVSAIFGADAARAVITLMQAGPGAIEGMTASISQQGAASELAGAQMKGWNGVVAGFTSQIETLQLLIGNHLLPILTPLGQKLAEAVGMLTQGDTTGFFTKIDEVLREALAQVTRFFAEIGTGTSVLSPFLNSLAAAFAPMGQMLIDQGKQWLTMFVDWLKKEGPPFLAPIGAMLVDQADLWLKELVVWIDTQVPVLLENLKKWGQQFVDWIEPQIDPMLEKLKPLMEKLTKWVDDQIPGLKAQLGKWAAEFGNWILFQAIPNLLIAGGTMVAEFLNFLADQSDRLNTGFKQWIARGMLGIGQAILDLPQNIADWLAGGMNAIYHQAGEMGRGLIDGFGRAIQDGIGWIGDQARNMAQAAINEAKRILGIASPSKVFMEMGVNVDKGYAEGMLKGTPMVQGAMAQMVAPPAYPQMGGATTINNSKSIDYHPSYGNGVMPSPQFDSAVARTMAL